MTDTGKVTEPVIILEPGDERAQKIAKAISSKTAGEILQVLELPDLVRKAREGPGISRFGAQLRDGGQGFAVLPGVDLEFEYPAENLHTLLVAECPRVAEGQRAVLNEFRAFLNRGSPASLVQQVEVKWETPTGEFERFGVRYI